jgi:sensor domain CHASE-containing protein
MRVTGRGQDQLRWPMLLAEQLVYLVQSVTGSDFAPTAPQREVQQQLSGQVREARARLERVMSGQVATFRQFVRARNLPNLLL